MGSIKMILPWDRTGNACERCRMFAWILGSAVQSIALSLNDAIAADVNHFGVVRALSGAWAALQLGSRIAETSGQLVWRLGGGPDRQLFGRRQYLPFPRR